MTKKTTPAENQDFSEDLADDVWEFDDASPSLIGRLVAEYLGTFVLMLIGLGVSMFTVVIGGVDAANLTVGLAWGLTVTALIVAVGAISGAHFNPAVTLGFWAAGRFPGRDVAPYLISQVLGAVTAVSLIIWAADSLELTSGGIPVTTKELVQTISIGHGENSPMAMDSGPGITGEIIATALLVAVILAATSVRSNPNLVPFTVGAALTVLVLFSIPFTNGSLNPARATGTAVFAGDWALDQLWVFWVTGIVAGVIVGFAFRLYGAEEDLETVEALEVIDD